MKTYVKRRAPLPNSSRYCTNGFLLISPDEVTSDREKILYTLWHIGELSYHKVHLYTGLKKKELDIAIDDLVERKKILAIKQGKSSDKFDNDNILCSYRVANID